MKVPWVYFWKYLGISKQTQYICLNQMVASLDGCIPRIILEILDFHEFCNLIGQEYAQMFLITFNWNLWNNLLCLWISIKRHLKLIYHFEVLWTCPAAPDQAKLIISVSIYIKKLTLCFNSFMKYWTFRNPAFWLVKRIFDNKTNPKNFAWHGNWNGKSSITTQSFLNSIKV